MRVRWLTWLLLLFGITVGMVSLYFSSILGLMGKLGLVGGDLNQAVRRNDLARAVYEVGVAPQCDPWATVAGVPKYLLAKPVERINLGLQLGKRRMECGMVYTMSGNVEKGIYTMIKGLYYDRVNHHELLKLVEEDRGNCKLYDSGRDYGYVEAYIESSEGNARESVLSLFHDVALLREKVAERCID